MWIEIADKSGFCFGVVTAINKAESELASSGSLYCLGDIVHNSNEVERLQQKGLKTITHAGMESLRGVKVLLRAHGEPPSTYSLAASRNAPVPKFDTELRSTTCPGMAFSPIGCT